MVGIGNSLAPLLGGWLAGFSYTWLFGVSAVVGLVGAVAMRWFVNDPRWQEHK
jgi:MFS family permease